MRDLIKILGSEEEAPKVTDILSALALSMVSLTSPHKALTGIGRLVIEILALVEAPRVN
jgi:hypothetical protein